MKSEAICWEALDMDGSREALTHGLTWAQAQGAAECTSHCGVMMTTIADVTGRVSCQSFWTHVCDC